MNKTEVEALAARFIHFLATGEADAQLFSADVFCDFSLPRWRLQAQGVGTRGDAAATGASEPGHGAALPL